MHVLVNDCVSVCLLLQGTPEAVEEVGAMLVEKLPLFMQSGDLEVQERACCILQLMKYIVKLQGIYLCTYTVGTVHVYISVHIMYSIGIRIHT